MTGLQILSTARQSLGPMVNLVKPVTVAGLNREDVVEVDELRRLGLHWNQVNILVFESGMIRERLSIEGLKTRLRRASQAFGVPLYNQTSGRKSVSEIVDVQAIFEAILQQIHAAHRKAA
jgi:hypothetical protein